MGLTYDVYEENLSDGIAIRIVSELTVKILNSRMSNPEWIRASRQTEKEIIEKYLKDGSI